MRIYVASKVRPHMELWRKLRDSGLPIVAGWLDWSLNDAERKPKPSEWRKHWAKCVSEASSADVLLFYHEDGEKQKGSLVECGAALSAGPTIFAVGADIYNFTHHPSVRRFKTLDKAIKALSK